MPASYTYAAAAEALGLPSDKRLRRAVRERRLTVKRLGHRTALIPFESLKRWADNRGLTLIS